MQAESLNANEGMFYLCSILRGGADDIAEHQEHFLDRPTAALVTQTLSFPGQPAKSHFLVNPYVIALLAQAKPSRR